jgi:hypothetical protein
MQGKQVKKIIIQINLQDMVKKEEKILIMGSEDKTIMKGEDRTIIKSK